jgi:hypothetical protein
LTLFLSIAIPLLLLYGLFLYWYGGNGKPMTTDEVEDLLLQISQAQTDQSEMHNLRALVSSDDGKEFVMHNLVRYRARALYPEGQQYGDDPRAADRRYGKAILKPLLRYGNLLVFIGKRDGTFIDPNAQKPWTYVAMVRYRSRRDFLRFVLASSKQDIFVHKWAAIEETHIFPVKPMVSLIMLRYVVGSALTLLGVAAFALLG